MQLNPTDLGHWVVVPAIIFHTGANVTISVLLERDSLQYPYILIETETSRALIPIPGDLSYFYNTRQICLHLPSQSSPPLVFNVPESQSLELLTSQLWLCSQMSKHQTPLPQLSQATQLFLKSLACPYVPPLPMGPRKTSLLPIISDTKARSTWFRRTQAMNTAYYTYPTMLRINFMTYNVGGVLPTLDITSEIQSLSLGAPDIAAIVLQEVDMSVKSTISGASRLASTWTDIVSLVLSRHNLPLSVASSVSLGGVLLIVLFSTECPVRLSILSSSDVRLGAMGVAANKGAILTRIRAGETTFSIIGAHLSAHKKEKELRDQQMKLISSLTGSDDFTFIAGDLNYRVDMAYEDAVLLSASGKYERLLAKDQLISTLKTTKDGWEEGEIRFPPTFKFDVGTDDYDTSSKRRTPSYTDRVLAKTAKTRMTVGGSTMKFEIDGDTEDELNYPTRPLCSRYAAGDLSLSDHRPVHAHFVCTAIDRDHKKYKEFAEYLQDKLEMVSERERPRVTAIPNDIVVPCTEVEKKVILRNTSDCWARWMVQLKGDGIELTPEQGIILPGLDEIVKLKIQPSSSDRVVVIGTEEKTLCSIHVKSLEI